MAGDRSMAVAGIYAEWALALLDLSLGHPAPVADRLGALRRRQFAAGAGEPGVVPFLIDEAEAAVALGRTAEAEAVLEWLEERGASLNRASALGAAARGRALLAGTRGDLAAAVTSCDRALDAYARAVAPFETARTQLLLGALQRRAKRRSAARETLGQAQVTSNGSGPDSGRPGRGPSWRRSVDDSAPPPVRSRPPSGAWPSWSPREVQQGDRGGVVRDAEDGRDAAIAYVRQARRALPYRADSPARQSVGIPRLSERSPPP